MELLVLWITCTRLNGTATDLVTDSASTRKACDRDYAVAVSPPRRNDRRDSEPRLLLRRVRVSNFNLFGLAVRGQHRLPGRRLRQSADPARARLVVAGAIADRNGARRHSAGARPRRALDRVAENCVAAAAGTNHALGRRRRRARRQRDLRAYP